MTALPLEGKVAIVTGSSRGIGKGIALKLAEAGCDVAICARSDAVRPETPGTLSEAAEAVRALGRRVVAEVVDVSKDADLARLVDRTYAELGRIDILVNNAAANAYAEGLGSFMEVSADMLDVAYRANVRSPWHLMHLAIPRMQEVGGGAVFNISSGSARMPAAPSGPPPPPAPKGAPGSLSVVYGTTKAALERFGVGIAPELWPLNVAVIGVRPGFTQTERLTVVLGPSFDFSHAEPVDLCGRAIAFMARDAMSYTGQVVQARAIVDANGL